MYHCFEIHGILHTSVVCNDIHGKSKRSLLAGQAWRCLSLLCRQLWGVISAVGQGWTGLWPGCTWGHCTSVCPCSSPPARPPLPATTDADILNIFNIYIKANSFLSSLSPSWIKFIEHIVNQVHWAHHETGSLSFKSAQCEQFNMCGLIRLHIFVKIKFFFNYGR